jgi:hypothetical protein
LTASCLLQTLFWWHSSIQISICCAVMESGWCIKSSCKI